LHYICRPDCHDFSAGLRPGERILVIEKDDTRTDGGKEPTLRGIMGFFLKVIRRVCRWCPSIPARRPNSRGRRVRLLRWRKTTNLRVRLMIRTQGRRGTYNSPPTPACPCCIGSNAAAWYGRGRRLHLSEVAECRHIPLFDQMEAARP
jgi:hypothetical protein